MAKRANAPKKPAPPTGGARKLEWTEVPATGAAMRIWRAPTTEGKPGATIRAHGQKWLGRSDLIYFVNYDAEYLGSNDSLDAAKERAERREKSPTALRDTVDGDTPAFLVLTPDERRLARGPARPAKQAAAAPPDDAAARAAAAMRASVAGSYRAKGAAAAPAEGSVPPRPARAMLDSALVLHVKTKVNPRKAGTTQGERYAKILAHDGSTVGKFLADGGDKQALKYAVDGGHVELK